MRRGGYVHSSGSSVCGSASKWISMSSRPSLWILVLTRQLYITQTRIVNMSLITEGKAMGLPSLQCTRDPSGARWGYDAQNPSVIRLILTIRVWVMYVSCLVGTKVQVRACLTCLFTWPLTDSNTSFNRSPNILWRLGAFEDRGAFLMAWSEFPCPLVQGGWRGDLCYKWPAQQGSQG